MITIHKFKQLPVEDQVEQLNQHAISLDIFDKRNGAEVALFALHNFYVELYIERFSDEIFEIKCFQSTRKLSSYLKYINIDEIKRLLKVRN